MTFFKNWLDQRFSLGQIFGWLGTAFVLLLLGAHFYRASQPGLVLCTAGVLFLLCRRPAWTRYAVAFYLLWGMAEWAASACELGQMRMMMDRPWMRATAILAGVAFVTGLAGLLVFRQAGRMARKQEADSAGTQGVAFIAVFLCLCFLREKAPIDFLLLERFFPGAGAVQMFFAAWYGAFVAGLLADRARLRKARLWLWLTFAAVFFGQFALGVLGVEEMLLTGRLHVPVPGFILYGPVFRDSLNVMPFIVLAATLLCGTAWCSMLCYFGPFDALASLGKPVRKLPPVLGLLLDWGRPAVLASGVLAAAVLRHIGLETAEAVSIALVYAFASLLAMAFVSRRWGGMLHCTAFCPMGVVANVLGRLSPWRLRVDAARCTGCGACEKACRYRALDAQSRAAGGAKLRCSLCRDCISVCRHDALSIRCAGMGPELSWKLFSGLLAMLHAVFLSVAMV